MPLKYSRYIPLVSLTGDFIILNLLFVVAFCLTQDAPDCFSPWHMLFYIYLNICWAVLVVVFGAHTINRNTHKKSILFAYIKIIVFFFFLFLMYFQVVPLAYYARDDIGFLFVVFFALLIGWKFSLYYAFLYYRKWGFNYKNVLILGDTQRTRELKNYFMTNKWHGYRFAGFIDEKANPELDVIGHWGQLKELIAKHHVDEIYIALQRVPYKVFQGISTTLADFPVRVRIVPDLGNFSYKTAELIQYGTIPVVQIHQGPLSYWYNRLLKRTFDVVFSLIIMVFILSWMTPVLYFLSLFNKNEGVFFRQKRTCIDGGVFYCLKYRTMRKNIDADRTQALPNDTRVTKVGRFLRRFSLDELPQFVNVLRGEMSVVGPRPHMLKHTEEYRKLVNRFMLRHTVKPGITGLAQVNGYRGPIINKADIRNRVKYDVKYIENWSFNMDVKIILLTIWVIIKGQIQAV
ncbi:MAG: exopolysaccharide biosynthesis polyprenyl glycosylphosphotransferase [Bacteroidia bacterium]|nr:MAG: exopolysaccharide biosynthesis polyprenyl glycosylphosphotransferase [Bacteroidia bacterium]